MIVMRFIIDKLYEGLLRNISLVELLKVVVGALILCKRNYSLKKDLSHASSQLRTMKNLDGP